MTQMRRRALLLGLMLVPTVALGQSAPPSPQTPAAHQRELEAWWQRQQQREAAERDRNRAEEWRRDASRWQVQRWEEQRWRARGWRSYPW
jgi:hypothetical protein